MEELTTKLNKAVKAAADLPEIPRDENGNILIDKISLGRDEKGRLIVPDDILEIYFKELPDGTINESKNAWTASKGILRKPTQEIINKGGEALRAKVEQRKKLAETVDILLQKAAKPEDLDGLELPEGVDLQTVGVARMIDKWIKTGDKDIFVALRDTVGEKPSDKLDASIINITPADEELIKRVAARLPENGNA